tara:strand:+ start:429 stop:1118 length:690 start_codon:yes stop_codon:yes gene_type:complete
MLKTNYQSSLIISSNQRSIIYLKILKKNYLLPKKIIFLKNRKEKMFNKKILTFLYKYRTKVDLKIFNTTQINSINISNYLKNLKSKLFLVSLYSGKKGIIKDKTLLKKKFFLHSHSGKLPEYKGSTTIYYSLLKDKKIWCDTFFLNEKIDQGKIICSNEYPIPKNITSIDKYYDAKIRALNLVSALKKLEKKKVKFKINKKIKSSYYYIMHPVLRLLTINKLKNVQNKS